MCDCKSGCLLWKRQRKFPDENDGRIYKKGKRAVLKFAGEIAANPRIGTQDRPMSLRPAARHIGEHRQDRQFVVVIPKNERIVPEQNEAEQDDNEAGSCRAKNVRTRGLRLGHLTRQTSNAKRPTPNVELGSAHHLAFFSAVRMLATKILISSSSSFKHVTRFARGPRFFTRWASRSHRFVSRSSLRQMRSLWRKFRRDSAASTSPWLEREDVPDRKSCPAM